jgi:cytochrome c-type biogenesis protein CcmF
MNAGTLLLGVAFLGGVGATAALFVDYRRDTEAYTRYAATGIAVTGIALAVALTYLTYQFVTTDYSNAYVWRNTADYLPLLYRVTGVYAGNEGSILLWATIAAGVSLWTATTRGIAGRSAKLVQGIVTGFVSWLVGMLLFQSPFASTAAVAEAVPAGVTPQTGQGLNPLLVDPFMAIHPPVMFTGYALVTMPFALGVAHFVSALRGDDGLYERWLGSVTRWLRVSWLFLTAAVALGAFWSYTVLGWGGIWAWDPVETAILVPWLFLTGTLHAVTNYRRGERYTVLAPAMTATTLALAVYTTSVVRSGVFRSVHSFAEGGIGASLLGLMGVTLLLGVGLPFGYWLTREGSGGWPDGWLTRSTLLHAAVLVFGLLTFVSLWGLTFPVLRDATSGIEVAVEARYYNLWSFPIVLAMLLLLGFYMDFDVESRDRSLFTLAFITTLTVAAATVAPSAAWRLGTVRPNDALVYQVVAQVSALAVVPAAAYVAYAVIKRGYQRVTAAATVPVRRKELGITTIHVAVALLVFSLPFTYLFATQASAIVTGDQMDGGQTVEVPNSAYSLRVLDREVRTLPENPDPSTYALSSQEVTTRSGSLNGSVRAVHGTITDIRRGERATVVQLDDSGVWVGVTGQNFSTFTPQTGQRVVANGIVLEEYVPQTDVTVLTSAANVGSPANPPPGVDPTRVRVQTVDLVVYADGEHVVSGEAGQRTYTRQNGLEVREVVVHRGLLTDTYVIAGVDEGTASLTVKRIPYMTLLRVSVVLLLVGMGLVLAYDPRHGLVHETALLSGDASARTDRADPEVSTDD